jgi:hypothetical protein
MTSDELSPLALRFEEALVPSRFSEQLRVSCENQLRRDLRANSNAALRPVLASANFVMDRRGLRVVFKGGIPKGAKLMRDRAGRALPTLVDGKTGRTLKNARAIGKAGKVAKAGATAAVAIVEVAHMISGHDNAKRLKKVELGVDRLVRAHESELKARLEAIYRHSKELLHNGLEELSPEDQRELHRQCRELVELRARWRDDFVVRLEHIDKADPRWFQKLFLWRRDEAYERARRQSANKAGEGLEIVQLMHFSLMLQMTLAGASGRMMEFRGATVPDECRIWADLQNFAERRVREISGSDAKEFQPFLNAISDMTNVWSSSALHRSSPPKQLTDTHASVEPKLGEPDLVQHGRFEETHAFFVGYPQNDGEKVSAGYVVKLFFAKELGNNFTSEDLLKQFVVRTRSQTSGRLAPGLEVPRDTYRINYDERRDAHALAVPLPWLSNGFPEWLHGIEIEMRRPLAEGIYESGRIYRTVRLVRS